MAHAERCPICGGKGTIPDESHGTTTSTLEKTCHGCNGRGWVEVGEDCPKEDNWPTEWGKPWQVPTSTIGAT